DETFAASYGQDATTLAFARIECHYFVHKGWLESEDQLLREAGRLAGIPGVIVQGRYDVVCPAQNAWDLHRAWPDSELIMVPDAGHSATEGSISKALVAATDRYAG
ncbi:MAG TPA: alpha/beta hydrolase, partial [Holophagaceae bacterium]|nr:alpha/beta hydrolase [Holophagaceae bacterium]